MTFPDAFADVVLSSAVLHFASSDDHFDAMLRGTWRVLKPGGLLFCRLASSIGMEQQIQRLEGRRFRLPDGSDRYLVDEPLLLRYTAELGGQLADPLKTTVVQNQRCMTTWVVQRTPESRRIMEFRSNSFFESGLRRSDNRGRGLVRNEGRRPLPTLA